MDDVVVRVARGAALLDEKLPGWDGQIDIAQLDITTFDKCICGQLYGRFTTGLSKLGVTDAYAYGFIGGRPGTEAWRELIARRRLAVLPVPAEVAC